MRLLKIILSKNINPSLVLVQPRKTRPYITERLLMGRKESNQTNKVSVDPTYAVLAGIRVVNKLVGALIALLCSEIYVYRTLHIKQKRCTKSGLPSSPSKTECHCTVSIFWPSLE